MSYKYKLNLKKISVTAGFGILQFYCTFVNILHLYNTIFDIFHTIM